jgi:hypothetical protein
VEEAHPKHPDYQFEEIVIVSLSNAVVKVSAMVVKSRSASVTLAAVLRTCQNMGIANLAVKVIRLVVEREAQPFALVFK